MSEDAAGIELAISIINNVVADLESQLIRLEQIIVDAPHHRDCASWIVGSPGGPFKSKGPCDCWKSRVDDEQ